MGLFPKEDVLPQEEATRQRAIVREVGTRRLIIGFIALLVLWFGGGKLWDAYLLTKRWPELQADEAGLTVVGTLNRRESYDRNLFQVVQIEGQTRAELTHYGWDSIFNGRNGPLSTEQTGVAIRNAINQDSETGYAMLTPVLASHIRTVMNSSSKGTKLTGQIPILTTVPITPEEIKQRKIPARPKTLDELISFFGTDSRSDGTNSGDMPESGGGSGTEHQVEHGLVVPAEVVVRVCPVVLLTRHFVKADLEEHAESAMEGKTYSVSLTLTDEGRSRFHHWSSAHANEHLLLILNKEIVASGRIKMSMNVDLLEITNLHDGPAAHRLVDFVNSRHH